jgi:hypothetical protein
VEKTLKEFRVLSIDPEIIGATCKHENLVQTTKLLMSLRKNFQYKIMTDGLAIPVPPILGKDNNPHWWWNISSLTTKLSPPQSRDVLEVFFTLPYLHSLSKVLIPSIIGL